MKTMLKKLPVILLALLLAVSSASYAAPATETESFVNSIAVESVAEAEVPVVSAVMESVAEVEVPAVSATVEPVAEVEAPVVSAAVEPVSEAEAPVAVEPEASKKTENNNATPKAAIAIVPRDETEMPEINPIEYCPIIYPKLIFWEESDHKMHYDPYCMTEPDDTPYTGCNLGTLEEAKATGHTEWCHRCSYKVDDQILFFEKTGNPLLYEDGDLIFCRNGDLMYDPLELKADGKYYVPGF